MCVYVRVLRINGFCVWTSSALAVAGKELVEQQLEHLVLAHGVVLAQVVAAGGAGVHLSSKRPLETSLSREEMIHIGNNWDYSFVFVHILASCSRTH